MAKVLFSQRDASKLTAFQAGIIDAVGNVARNYHAWKRCAAADCNSEPQECALGLIILRLYLLAEQLDDICFSLQKLSADLGEFNDPNLGDV